MLVRSMFDLLRDQPAVLLPLFLAVGVLMATIGLFNLIMPAGERFAKRVADTYEVRFVDQLQFVPVAPVVFQLSLVLLILACALILVFLPILQGLSITAALLTSTVLLPKVFYVVLKTERRKKIDKVLPNVLQQLAANFRSTSDISRALAEVAETAPKPMDHELRLIRQKENDLKSFPDALDQARRRIGSDWFDVVAAVLKTTYEKGGKESDALMNLSRVFVQLTKMRDRLDTATSQGRMSMRIIMVMPFLVVIIALVAVPDIAAGAWASNVGKFMLALAVLVYIIAVSVAIWLSSVKV